MTQRLPTPGGDDGDWGDILNSYLEVSLDPDGTLKPSAISSAGGEVTSNKGAANGYAPLNGSSLVPSTNLGAGSASSSNYLRGDGTWTVPNSGSSSLAADSDVAIVSPSNNQVLTYNSGASKWENIAPAVSSVAGKTGAVTLAEGDVTNLTTDLAATEKTANKGAASGYAPLNGSSQVPIANIPTGTSGTTVAIGNDSRITGALQSGATAGGDLTGTYPNPTLSGTTNVESIIAANSTVTSKAPTASPTFTGKVTTPALQVTTGAGTANQVLTSDTSGNATWVTPASGGAQALVPTAVQTSAYSANPADFVPVDTTSGNVIVTLPTAPADKTRIGIKMIKQGSTNTVTINSGGSDVFNKTGGVTTETLTLLNQGMLLQYASSSNIWYIQADDLALAQLDTRYAPNGTYVPTSGFQPGLMTPTHQDALALAASLLPIQIDAGGPYLTLEAVTSPAYNEQPSWCWLPNGHIFAVWRYTSNGSDTTGQGVMQSGVFDKFGNVIVAASTFISNGTYDLRQPTVDMLSDGRIFITHNANAVGPGGGSGGIITGPDGNKGNVWSYVCTVSGDTVTLGTEVTIVSGFTTSTGYDWGTGGRVYEPTAGVLIIPMTGNNSVNNIFTSANLIGYMTATYTPGGGGGITVGSFQQVASSSSAAGLSSFFLEEPCFAFCTNGDTVCYFRASNSQLWLTRCVGGISGTPPTGTWATPVIVPNNVGSVVYAQPNVCVLASGAHVFATRSNGTGTNQTGKQAGGQLVTSIDNGTTFQIQALDLLTAGAFAYGKTLEVSGQPGLALVIYGQGSAIRGRYIIEGVSTTPLAAEIATNGVFSRTDIGLLDADGFVIGGPNSPAPSFGTTPIGMIPGAVAGTFSPIYGSGHALPEYKDMATDIGVVMQPWSRAEGNQDSNVLSLNPLASGTLYVWAISVDQNVAFRYLRIWWGAATVGTVTHSWATFIRSPSNLAAKFISTDVTSGGNLPAANGSTKFDFGSGTNYWNQATQTSPVMSYLGVVVVTSSGNPPSMIGKPAIPALTLKAPILAGPSGNTGLTTPPGSLTMVNPTTGGSWIPYWELSTT